MYRLVLITTRASTPYPCRLPYIEVSSFSFLSFHPLIPFSHTDLTFLLSLISLLHVTTSHSVLTLPSLDTIHSCSFDFSQPFSSPTRLLIHSNLLVWCTSSSILLHFHLDTPYLLCFHHSFSQVQSFNNSVIFCKLFPRHNNMSTFDAFKNFSINDYW